MSDNDELPLFPDLDHVSIDVRALVQRSQATLYSSLVTRPTGRAVRMAIESQLAEQVKTSDAPALSLIDMSEVSVLDFSCADEVVARLLARYMAEDRPLDAFFVFLGVAEHHLEPIEAVLARHDLVAVAEVAPNAFRLLGTVSREAQALWEALDSSSLLPAEELNDVVEAKGGPPAFEELVKQRLVVRLGSERGVQALSSVVRALR